MSTGVMVRESVGEEMRGEVSRARGAPLLALALTAFAWPATVIAQDLEVPPDASDPSEPRPSTSDELAPAAVASSATLPSPRSTASGPFVPQPAVSLRALPMPPFEHRQAVTMMRAGWAWTSAAMFLNLWVPLQLCLQSDAYHTGCRDHPEVIAVNLSLLASGITLATLGTVRHRRFVRRGVPVAPRSPREKARAGLGWFAYVAAFGGLAGWTMLTWADGVSD